MLLIPADVDCMPAGMSFISHWLNTLQRIFLSLLARLGWTDGSGGEFIRNRGAKKGRNGNERTLKVHT